MVSTHPVSLKTMLTLPVLTLATVPSSRADCVAPDGYESLRAQALSRPAPRCELRSPT
jgi:hypothetical protein